MENLQIEKIEINKLNPAKYSPRKGLKPGDAEKEHRRGWLRRTDNLEQENGKYYGRTSEVQNSKKHGTF